MANASEIIGGVTDWLEFVAAIVAALVIVRGLGNWLAASVGRPWQLARKIKQIAPGMRIDSLRDLLWPPRLGSDESQTWAFPECFIHVAVHDGRVLALAVTLRRPWFRVQLSVGGLAVQGRGIRLGKATFSDVSAIAERFGGVVGANRWGYSELVEHGGSVSNFMQWAISLNDAGVVLEADALGLAGAADAQADERVATLRRGVRFNTIAIAAPRADLDCIRKGPSYGVDLYEARLAPTSRPAWMTIRLLRSTSWARSWTLGR